LNERNPCRKFYNIYVIKETITGRNDFKKKSLIGRIFSFNVPYCAN